MSAFVAAISDPSISVERAAAMVGHELEPSVDVDETLARIDALAEPLRARVSAGATPTDHAALLADYLGQELGFHGHADDYYAPENSLLDRVVARRLGIPITLAVVYVAVATRVGIHARGIGFPGHFLVRVGGEPAEGGVFLDVFSRGQLVDETRMRELVARFVGAEATLSPEHVAPVDARGIAVRMLRNLEAAYARRTEHARAWVAADRLASITGDDAHLRNRGLHAMAMGSNALAAEDLAAYLNAYANAPDRDRVEALIVRARKATRGTPLN